METTPLPHLDVEHHTIPPHARLPNSQATGKPLLIYRSAFRPSGAVTPDAVEAHLQKVGAVVPQWRYGMYPTTHFHSTAHEVLVVVRGRARLCFGGEGNPERVEREVGVGDVVVIPAGVGHRLLEDLGGFEMVGSYMPGCEWDMCYGREGEEDKVRGIKGLGWFGRDPVYGDEGPVLDV
ncbi:hypothetical protein CONLIGDRAFT_622957 [Coniochaeta ligniaria NRRL 30616]|uniref:Cupin type-1 domain-containing protein n=1 Tax=Coniochaeta ligniaria NRRL 30616 TaxID=1408157 RepID=A0A1J7JCS7_9PEZI|nr:hypothetical protein CONLIGDRAFT_622957 [Coniochaeta ligniaria NRRL 30616]